MEKRLLANRPFCPKCSDDVHTWEGLMDSELHTAKEISKYLRLPLSTVYKLTHEKSFLDLKWGGIGDFEMIQFENG